MPGPYRRLDVANVNQHVVTAKPEPKKAKPAKKAAAPVPPVVEVVKDDVIAPAVGFPGPKSPVSDKDS